MIVSDRLRIIATNFNVASERTVSGSLKNDPLSWIPDWPTIETEANTLVS